MTTTVKVEAHCAEGFEVEISVMDDPSGYNGLAVIQNGQSWQGVVYDAKSIMITERKKDNAS